MVIREHVLLAPMTTFEVGGEARFFLDAEDEQELIEALAWASARGIDATILGGGSNVLVSDRGVDGLVVRIRIRGVRESASGDGSKVVLEVGAGERLDALVERAALRGLAGIECLSGIPGYVGATPIQNVGAYGQEIGETIVSVRAMHRESRAIELFDQRACGFSYRSSVFKEALRSQYVVSTVTLALAPGGLPKVRYAELARELAARGGDERSLATVRETVLAIRRSKSMVIVPADPNARSAGSFFVNPVVDPDRALEIEGASQAKMPRFPSGDRVKLSAAWLIENAGFPKGTSDGPVGLSTRHALAVVNRGGATASQILAFARKVQGAVRSRFGVTLVPEPVLVGFTEEEAAALR